MSRTASESQWGPQGQQDGFVEIVRFALHDIFGDQAENTQQHGHAGEGCIDRSLLPVHLRSGEAKDLRTPCRCLLILARMTMPSWRWLRNARHPVSIFHRSDCRRWRDERQHAMAPNASSNLPPAMALRFGADRIGWVIAWRLQGVPEVRLSVGCCGRS
jgi:hypothetical protein